MKIIVLLLALFGLSVAQYGDSSGIGAGLTLGSNGIGNGRRGNGNDGNVDPDFFRDGRDGDIRSLWSFGVNGFFIPPPDFAGLPFLATNGTIIPTSAVGLICFDGVGGCSLELTAVVGGNLGRQVFNVSMNKVRLISSLCRVRVSRLGRVVVTAKLSEVSSRLLPMPTLSIPIVVVAQLASKQFAFIEFDQLFVMQGQAVRIRRFDDFLNNNNRERDRDDSHDGWGSSMGGGMGGMGGPNGGPGAPGPSGPGGKWGDVMGGNNVNRDRDNHNRFGVCPNLLDDSQLSDGNGGSSWNGGGYGGGNGGGYGGGYGGRGNDDWDTYGF